MLFLLYNFNVSYYIYFIKIPLEILTLKMHKYQIYFLKIICNNKIFILNSFILV